MPTDESFDLAWVAMNDDEIYKGLMDEIERFKVARAKAKRAKHDSDMERYWRGRQLTDTFGQPPAQTPPARERPEWYSTEGMKCDTCGEIRHASDLYEQGEQGSGPPLVCSQCMYDTDEFDDFNFDDDDDMFLDDDDTDNTDDVTIPPEFQHHFTEEELEEMNDPNWKPSEQKEDSQNLAEPKPATDGEIFANDGNAEEVTSTHSDVRNNLKAQIEAKRAEADEAREPKQYPSIFASTEPNVVAEILRDAEEGNEEARKHLYNSMAEIEDHFPNIAAEVQELFGKAKTVRNDVADSSFILKNPFANPFDSSKAFAINEEPQKGIHPTHTSPVIKSEPPKEEPDIGFDVVEGDDLSLLPASLFAKNNPGGDDMSLLPSGWQSG